MPVLKNPFKPTAGMNPPELVGRDFVLEDFFEALDNGPGAPERLMRISGVRGTGKTVLLNALGQVARSKGFEVVDVTSNTGFCGRIRDLLIKDRPHKSVTLDPSILGVSLGSLEMEKAPESLGDAMMSAATKGGLLVTLDEIQDAPLEEMRALGNEFQLLIRQEANVAFVFAGLPSAVDNIVGGESLTFLQRAVHIQLERLRDTDVFASLQETIHGTGMTISTEATSAMVQAIGGYPFMLQLVGYYSWQKAARRQASSIDMSDVEAGITKARDSFDAMVIEPALRRLPERQLDYLFALAACPEQPASSADVAAAMGLTTKEAGSYRSRLIAANILESPRFGTVDFAIPYMREYLLRQEQ